MHPADHISSRPKIFTVIARFLWASRALQPNGTRTLHMCIITYNSTRVHTSRARGETSH